jgi:site-specific DNA recombinase
LEKEEFEPLQTELRQRTEEQQQNAALQLVIGRMKEFAEKVGAGLTTADWATRRAIIRAVVKRIDVDEQEVRIRLSIYAAPSRLAIDMGTGIW